MAFKEKLAFKLTLTLSWILNQLFAILIASKLAKEQNAIDVVVTCVLNWCHSSPSTTM